GGGGGGVEGRGEGGDCNLSAQHGQHLFKGLGVMGVEVEEAANGLIVFFFLIILTPSGPSLSPSSFTRLAASTETRTRGTTA
ncbi:hypothetical protein PMAYCL1PPCAC_24083, partial [Pristionchus mayeri]